MARNALSQRSLQDAPIFRLLLKVAVKGTHQCDYSNFWGSFGLPTEQKQERDAHKAKGARETVEPLSRATPLLPRELRGARSRHRIQATSVAESGCSSRVGAATNSWSFSVLSSRTCTLCVLAACGVNSLHRSVGASVGRTDGPSTGRRSAVSTLPLRYSFRAE